MEGNNSLFLPAGSPFQYDDTELEFGQTIEMDSSDDFANLNETNIDNQDVKGLEPEPVFRAIGRDQESGYDLYPTLPPWGRNNKFSYDQWGQLSVGTMFEKADLQEYLYNHPLKSSLIIWIQRHPSQATYIYKTHYGASCRYKKCRPLKGNPHAITVGHYRVAIDELTGRHPKHKADTYIHAAFFHISCFEDMFDLAQITRDFDVRCENRPVVNAPHGERRTKNRMLLEERRIPHAVTEWLGRARENPNWKTTRVEDGMNYLVFTQKFSLRPHRRKCTNVPGMEKLGRDISHLGAPRPVLPNSIWGGKRVKGLTVYELAALEAEGSLNFNSGINKRSAQSAFEDEDEEDYSPPPARRARLSSPVGDEEDPIVLASSNSPSPVRFQRPGKLRDEPYKSERQQAVRQLQYPVAVGHPAQQPVQVAQTTAPAIEAAAGPAQQRASHVPGNTLNTSALPRGAIIRTAGGEYLCNPVTGALEQILSVTIIGPEQAPSTSTVGTSRAQYPQNPAQNTVPTAQMGFLQPAPAPTPQMGYAIPNPVPTIAPTCAPTSAPTARMVPTPLIDPTLRAPVEKYATTHQVKEQNEEPAGDLDELESLFGDSPPKSVHPATAQLENQLPAEDPEALGDLDLFPDVQHPEVEHVQVSEQIDPETIDLNTLGDLFDDVQPREIECAQVPEEIDPEITGLQALDDLFNDLQHQEQIDPETTGLEALDDFDISQYQLNDAPHQGMGSAHVPEHIDPETMVLDESIFDGLDTTLPDTDTDMDSFINFDW